MVEPSPANSASASRSNAQVVIRAVLFVTFSLISLAALAIGVNVDGHSDPSSQCVLTSERPAVGGPFYESTTTIGVRTFFPLGITCSFDSPDDAVGPQTVAHAQWGQTVVWALFGIAAVGALVPMRSRRSHGPDHRAA